MVWYGMLHYQYGRWYHTESTEIAVEPRWPENLSWYIST